MSEKKKIVFKDAKSARNLKKNKPAKSLHSTVGATSATTSPSMPDLAAATEEKLDRFHGNALFQ